MPQILILLFLALTTLVGVWKVLMTQEVALSLAWNALNTMVFAVFVSAAWRERRTRKARGAGQAGQPTRITPEVLDRETPVVTQSVGVAS